MDMPKMTLCPRQVWVPSRCRCRTSIHCQFRIMDDSSKSVSGMLACAGGRLHTTFFSFFLGHLHVMVCTQVFTRLCLMVDTQLSLLLLKSQASSCRHPFAGKLNTCHRGGETPSCMCPTCKVRPICSWAWQEHYDFLLLLLRFCGVPGWPPVNSLA
jgi:hypothetical protein